MKKCILFLFLTWLSLFSMAQNIHMGGSKYDVPTSLGLFSDGSLGLLGYSKSTEDYNDQVFMIRCTDAGELIWEKAYGGIYGDHPYDFCINSDDEIMITGESWNGFNTQWGRENIFMLQLNSEGDKIAEKEYYQYMRDMGFRIKPLEDNSYIVNGFSKSGDDDYGEMIITKIDSDLEILWQTVVGEPFSVDYGFEIIPNEQGFLAIGSVGGFFNSNQVDFKTTDSDILVAQIDHEGHLLWKDHYGGDGHDWLERAVVVNEEIYLIGSTQSEGAGSFDVLLMKMSMEGDSLFFKTYGSEYYDQGRSISYSNDRLFLGGVTKKQNDPSASANYILATDLNGEVIWERVIESTDSDKLEDMVFNHELNALYCLSSSHNDSTGIDFWLYTLNEEGQFLGIYALSKVDLQVIPNPLREEAKIQLPDVDMAQAELFIYNLNGQLLIHEKAEIHHHYYPFSADGLASGFYTFKILLKEGRQYSGKFIVY